MSIRICLDPGHVAGYNAGVAAGYTEGAMSWYLAQDYKEALEGYGFEVVLTRGGLQDNPSLEARGKLAVAKGCKVFLSLHSDASGNAATRGVTCIRSLQRPGSAELARALAKAAKEAMGAPFSPYAGATADGEWTRAYSNTAWGLTHDYYGVIRAAVTGACVEHAFLLEHSFHTNPTDCKFLDQAANRRRLARAAAKALAGYFDLTARPETPDAPAHGKLTTVNEQLAAFSDPAGARRMAEELAAQGRIVFLGEKEV